MMPRRDAGQPVTTPKIRPMAAVTAIASVDGHSERGATERCTAEMTAKRAETGERDERHRGGRRDA